MITAKYILENEAGERFDLTAPANIFLVNVEGLGITTNVTYGDLENGFFHTLYEQTPQNNITGDLIYQNAAYDNYQTLVNWIVRSKTIYFCYQPLETEYRRIVKLNYIVKERRTAGGWMRAGISFAPLTPWYLAQPTEIGMGGIEEELSKGYFQDGEASPTIEPVQDLHGYDHPWPGGGGKNLFDFDQTVGTTTIVTSSILLQPGTYYVYVAGKSAAWNSYTQVSADGTTYSTAGTDSSVTTAYVDATMGYNRKKCILTVVTPVYCRQRLQVNANVQNSRVAIMYTADSSGYETVPIAVTYDDPAWAAIYEPYANICPITPGLTLVRDDESTLEVYGGTLDVVNGVLMVDRAYKSLTPDDVSQMSANHYAPIWRIAYKGVTGIAKNPASTSVTNIISNAFKAVPEADRGAAGTCFISSSNQWIQFDISDTGISTQADAFSYFFGLNPSIVYELATPITYQLTEAEVSRALDALGVSYGYRYTEDLRYGGDAAGTMSATIAPSGHVPAAVVLRYSGAITNPRVRLVGAETGIVYGICAINTSLASGQTFELSTRYEDSHVMLIDGDGTESSLLGYVNQAYETYFRCPTTESAVLTIESDGAFAGDATLLVYTYFGSV